MEKLAQFLEPEKLNQVLELKKKIWDEIGKLYNYHSSAGDHVNKLKRKWGELECQKTDVEEKMNSELFPGKRPKREVQLWLQEVETINGEIQTIEEEGSRGIWKYFPRMHMGKLACQKIQEVEELHQRGGCFRDSLVVDQPVSHREELPTTTLVGERTTKRTIERVREHLLDENFRRIAVYGMGGIGKTTVMKQINNDLSKERDKFDNIIWVTVSKPSSVFKLQHDIACKLKLDLTNFGDETTRAGKLNNELKNWKRYVLILDDVWEAFPLEDVGIPEPTPTNGCRLLLTTRSLEVCNRMDCVNIKMELLSKEDSWDLFLDKVGRDVLNTRDIEPIVKKVVKECACLPLAIVTIAGSLKNVIDVSEWRNALNELRTPKKGPKNVDAVAIFERLRFSYERLKDEDLQHCLLYCALFPEDHEFERDRLIEDLIDEGIIERMESRQAEFDRGHTMLNKLERACLLETGINRDVKLHDLIRDMALEIAGPKFMGAAGDRVIDFMPHEERWGKDLEKVCLMGRGYRLDFPNISPRCPKLSTLLLHNNFFGGIIANSFFVHLRGLKVLHIRHSEITSLPNSISDLENLATLRLISCFSLSHIPSLAKLMALRKLDLGGSNCIEEIPHGLEMLVNLRYLNLEGTKIPEIPSGILSKLSQLQVLKFNRGKLNVEEIVSSKLECFKGAFYGVDDFNKYVGSLREGRLSQYQFLVTAGVDECEFWESEGKCVMLYNCDVSLLPKDAQTLTIHKCDNFGKLNVEEIVSLKLECFKGAFYGVDDFNKYVGSLREGRLSHYQFMVREMTAKIDDCVVWESAAGKCVLLSKIDDRVSLLPKDAQTLVIFNCDNLRSSSDAPYLECARELKSISIVRCEEIEDVLSYSYTFPLQSLDLRYLGKLQVLFREEKVASPLPLDIPPGTFSCLKQFIIARCPNIKKLFTPGLLQNLANLEEIVVGYCERLEEIIGAASDEVEEEIEDTTIFPRLRELVLYDMPRLETICSSSNAIVCDSLQNIKIVKCPKLKRLPLSLRDEQLSSPPSSLEIITEKEWWELLEWDNHVTKNALEPLRVDPDDDESSTDGSDSDEEPLSSEISMDGSDSHEEPLSNQQ
ncbi:disease resistance protein RPS2-like [Quercus robur]|uniref:disease resistance protein RPS2-like n=1 Tax=Quercus robur TaxID=38942 RepID=UPI0021629763|nr:disease resistance protein RPS2-like [Quercus robur]XP_050246173.1 disease resistance protein RPS2-like [Quercus robur]XP_050246174.1 disease resistance protein RPS2-like [Quercus robur]